MYLSWSGKFPKDHLGPLLFTIYSNYTSNLFDIIEYHLPDVHVYADTQQYITFNPNGSVDKEKAIAAIELCSKDLRSWMIKDKLKSGDGKTVISYAFWHTPTATKGSLQ